MGDENPIRTLGDYSKPSHEGYRNTIELPVGNNVVPLRSDTIRLVQNGCSFHGLRSEDPNQHLKDFLKLVDSLDLDGENRERTRLCLFQFSLRDQASNWLERLPAGSITTWEDLTTRFLAQFFPPGRTAKLRNDILMFQQHHGESLSEAWTRFKDLLQKVPHHGIDHWLQILIFYDHVPRCMAWLDYDEHVDSLSTMDNEVRVTSPESTTQTLPEVPSFDGPEPQPLLNSPSLDVSLGDVIGPEPPIKPHSPDSSRMKVVDYLTTQTPPSPHVANSHPKGVYSYYNPGINDPKRHYGFKLGLLGKSVSLGVDISNWEMFDDDWGLESKEVSPLGEELSLFDRPNEVERGRILEARRLEPILQQQISQRMTPSHHDDDGDGVANNTRPRHHDTCDGVTPIPTASNVQVIFDEKKLGSS
ncbi:zinc finger, CCHC-type containing protein [Tanacetum coccineum]